LKIGWIVLGVILLGVGLWVQQPLPWAWWQVLLNPNLWIIVAFRDFLQPWSFLLMLGGGLSAVYGVLAGKKKR